MNYNYLIAQGFALIAFTIALIAYHRKTKEKIFGTMIISHLCNIIHYVLLGAYSGCITKVIALLRDLFVKYKDKNKKLSSNIFLILFIVIYIVAGILTYNTIWSLFPILAAVTYLIPIWNGNELVVKRSAFFCYFLWLIYNIFVFSIVGIVSNIISIISTFIAMINETKKQRKKEMEN